MKSRYIIGILAVCIAISLWLRIVFPYDQIFTGEWVKFSSNDAYWQMASVDRIAPVFPSYILQIFHLPFFVWLLSGVTWCIGLGSSTQHTIDTVGVYFPTILAALTVVPVYFVGKAMFGKAVGIMAAFLIAVLPGEWLGRSVLGFTDHHVLEVLLSTTLLMFFVMAFKAEGRKRIVFISLTALTLWLCLLTSLAGVVFVFIIAVFLVTQVVSNFSHGRKEWYPVVLIAIGVGATGVFCLIKPYVVGAILRMSGALSASGSTAITTIEMRPTLFPNGVFTLEVIWASYGLITLLVPAAIILLLYRAIKTGHSSLILLVVWSLITLVLMLQYRRFAYYFAVNASLLTGWFTWYLWGRTKDFSKVFAYAAVGILFLAMAIPNLQHSVALAKNVPFTPPDAWCETLDWVEENTSKDSVILSWWDYGYWIERMAQRKAYSNPSQDKIPVTNTANMFLSGEGVEADYIIIDFATTVGKMWAVATWAGRQPQELFDTYYIASDGKFSPVLLSYPEYYRTFAVRLYNFNGVDYTPQQSTVIEFNPSTMILNKVDVYPIYEEAVQYVGLGQRLVGTSPFISPVPLDAISTYTLVYESEHKINGVSEVKVFRKERPPAPGED